jgi:hypothetical protein
VYHHLLPSYSFVQTKDNNYRAVAIKTIADVACRVVLANEGMKISVYKQ